MQGSAEALGDAFEIFGGVGQVGFAEVADGLFDVMQFAFEFGAGRAVAAMVRAVRPSGAVWAVIGIARTAIRPLWAFWSTVFARGAIFLTALRHFSHFRLHRLLVFFDGGLSFFLGLAAHFLGFVLFTFGFELGGFFHGLFHVLLHFLAKAGHVCLYSRRGFEFFLFLLAGRPVGFVVLGVRRRSDDRGEAAEQ